MLSEVSDQIFRPHPVDARLSQVRGRVGGGVGRGVHRSLPRPCTAPSVSSTTAPELSPAPVDNGLSVAVGTT